MGSVYEKCMNSYPLVLFAALIGVCMSRRLTYLYAVGYAANTVANYGLKLFFRQLIGPIGNRPLPYRPHNPLTPIPLIGNSVRNADSYGFPSGHAQSVGYFLAFAHHVLPWRSWHAVIGLLLAAWLLYTRVAFRRHTPVQVIAGFAFGAAFFHAFRVILLARN
jgi:membrane-associated phospholipid phosphatase